MAAKGTNSYRSTMLQLLENLLKQYETPKMKAAWPHFETQKYGRLVFVGSVAWFRGGFGQGNYAAAKGALCGLNGICAVEGFKNNVYSNLICTEGVTRMTENIFPKEIHDQLKPEFAANAVLALCHESCPTTGAMYQTEGDTVRQMRVQAAEGFTYDPSKSDALDTLSANWEKTQDFTKNTYPAEDTHPKVERRAKM